MHRVGLQLGGGSLQFAAAVAGLVEKLAGAAQKFVDFRKAGAELVFLELKQAFPRLARVALGLEVGGLLLEMKVLGFSLQSLCRGGFDLGDESLKALAHFTEQQLNPSEDGGSRTMAFFQCRNPGHAPGTGLGRVFATLSHYAERFLSRCDLLLQLSSSLFEEGDFRLACCADRFL